MKKVLSTILALVSSMMLNAQVVDSSALDSIKAQFEFERGEKVDSFNIEVEKAYRDEKRWARMAMLNTASCGKFTSDRTIEEYAQTIWNLDKVIL